MRGISVNFGPPFTVFSQIAEKASLREITFAHCANFKSAKCCEIIEIHARAREIARDHFIVVRSGYGVPARRPSALIQFIGPEPFLLCVLL